MSSMSRILDLLNKYGIKAKFANGQNFLVDDRAIKVICDAVHSFNFEEIVEIGSGLGSITYPLVSRETKVIAYDVDPDMVEILKREITSENLEVIHADFLKVDLSTFDNKRTLIVGNLPYNITKKLLLKVLRNDPPFTFLFMIQKEVADKLFFKPGAKTNNALAAALALSGELKRVIDLGPSSFYPSPSVSSTFLSYVPIKPLTELEKLERIFVSNNKTLRSNFKGIDQSVLDQLLDIIKIPTLRAHELTLDQIKRILELPLF